MQTVKVLKKGTPKMLVISVIVLKSVQFWLSSEYSPEQWDRNVVKSVDD